MGKSIVDKLREKIILRYGEPSALNNALQKSFRKFSAGRGSQVDVNGLERALLYENISASHEQVLEAFNTIDKDNSGFISCDEFRDVMFSAEDHAFMTAQGYLTACL